MTSQAALQAALAPWTDEVFLECLTFTHASLSSPIRLVNDRQDLTRGADTFLAFPFSVRLGESSDDGIGAAEVRADGVDQSLIDDLRSIEYGLTLVYEVVLASSPTTVEHGPISLEVKGVVADLASVTLTVAYAADALADAFPKDHFAPWNSAD